MISLQYPEFRLLPATTDEVEKDFLGIVSDAYGPPPMTHELFELDLAEGWYARHDCLVMYDGANPVAAGQIRTETHDGRLIGFLDTLGVPKGYRGKGYGTEMTIRRIRELIRLGVSEIRSEVEPGNEPMLKLLDKLGFIRD